MSQHHSIDSFLNLKRLEPYIGIALGCHGILMLNQLGGTAQHWLSLGIVSVIALLAFVPALQTRKATQIRAILYTLITAYLILTTGASKSFFLLWYFVIITFYPLLLGSVCGISLIVFISGFYLSTLLYTPSSLPVSVVFARTLLLSFIGILSYHLSSRLRSFDRLQILAITDSLTGLKNRRCFFEIAEQEFSRAKRYKSQLCMIISDVDNFKQLNDTYGHALGDEALVLCAQLLRNETRETDIVCRLGGDEFAILLPNTSWDDASATVKRLKGAFQTNPLNINDASSVVQMSFGISEVSETVNSITELYKNADLSMYRDKSTNDDTATQNNGIQLTT